MKNYFELTYCDEELYAPFGVAYAPANTDAFLLPPTGEQIANWEPLEFELRDGGFADYLSNDLGARLCSESMRLVIDRNRSECDEIQWLPVSVRTPNGIARACFILHFPKNFDVFNKRASIMSGDVMVEPVLDKDQTAQRNLFGFPSESGRTTYVSSHLKAAMEGAGLTGIECIPVRVE